MTAVPSYFDKFLRNIRLTQNMKENCVVGHKTLRDRLNDYADLKDDIVTTFLQGSYRRFTGVRPKGDKKADVDVVVVTRLRREDYPDPDDAMEKFEPFLKKFYKDKYERQGRSFGITLGYVSLDLVVTSAPSEADENILLSSAVKTAESLEEAPDWRLQRSWVPVEEREEREELSYYELSAMKTASREEPEWKTEPLWIPDRNVGEWTETNPLAQLVWTRTKNARCDGYYLDTVRSIKWWRQLQDDLPRYPKGYPVEHMVGYCCPDDIESVGEGVTLSLEGITREFASNIAEGSVPELYDHGVDQDVLRSLSFDEFRAFYERVSDAATLARQALDADTISESANKWRELFSSKFPPPPEDDKKDEPKGPFTPPSVKSSGGDYRPRRFGIGG